MVVNTLAIVGHANLNLRARVAPVLEALRAASPNVYVKLGGIGMARAGFDWHARSAPIASEDLAASMAPFMTYCVEQFGPAQCMFESDFPVDKVSYSYNVMGNAFKRLSKGCSAAERVAMFHDTAARVYRTAV